MKQQGFALPVKTWLSIIWPFSTKTRVKDVLDNYDLVKLIRAANNREAFRNAQTR